jgi:hypothetical protein
MVGKLPYFRLTKRVVVKMNETISFPMNKCKIIETRAHILFVRVGSAYPPLVTHQLVIGRLQLPY